MMLPLVSYWWRCCCLFLAEDATINHHQEEQMWALTGNNIASGQHLMIQVKILMANRASMTQWHATTKMGSER
jgi:hypothetical protein